MPKWSLAFKPKKVPAITRGRLQHAVFGAAVVLALGAFGRYVANAPDWLEWGQWGIVFVFFFALAWEAATPWLAARYFKSWDHPYGDFPDWMAYFVGAIIPLFIMDRIA